jgi:hypothetical protein
MFLVSLIYADGSTSRTYWPRGAFRPVWGSIIKPCLPTLCKLNCNDLIWGKTFLRHMKVQSCKLSIDITLNCFICCLWLLKFLWPFASRSHESRIILDFLIEQVHSAYKAVAKQVSEIQDGEFTKLHSSLVGETTNTQWAFFYETIMTPKSLSYQTYFTTFLLQASLKKETQDTQSRLTSIKVLSTFNIQS